MPTESSDQVLYNLIVHQSPFNLYSSVINSISCVYVVQAINKMCSVIFDHSLCTIRKFKSHRLENWKIIKFSGRNIDSGTAVNIISVVRLFNIYTI